MGLKNNGFNKGEMKLDFVGIGVEKSATTWLFDCISEHPETCCSARKELWYFNSSYDRGSKYLNYWFKNCSYGKEKGEFTPTYLYSNLTALRIKRNNPNMKIICVLRNPVDMIYSLWFFSRYRLRREERDFEEAIKGSPEFYIEKGHYYKYLQFYEDLFPRDNIKVILFDEIKQNPAKVIYDIYKFLNIDPNYKPSMLHNKSNTTGVSADKKTSWMLTTIMKTSKLFRKIGFGFLFDFLRENTNLDSKLRQKHKNNVKKTVKPPMNPETRQWLENEFADSNRILSKMLWKELGIHYGWVTKKNVG